MRLRRGMVRQSCDYCYRRKIKCDFLSRQQQGHPSCSQCSLRHVPCRLDDSDDIRLRSRQQQHRTSTAQLSAEDDDDFDTKADPRALADNPGSDTDAAAVDPDANLDAQQSAPPRRKRKLEPFPNVTDVVGLATPATALHQQPQASSYQQPYQPQTSYQQPYQQPVPPPPPPQPAFQEPYQFQYQQPPPAFEASLPDDFGFGGFLEPFPLNPNSVLFLDRIFMGEPEPAAGWAAAQPLPFQPLPPHQQHYQQTQWDTTGMAPPVTTASELSTPSTLLQTPAPQLQPSSVHQSTLTALLSPPPTTLPHSSSPPSVPPLPPLQQALQPARPTWRTDGGYHPPPWQRCGLDEPIFLGAMRAFFEFASLYLPVLLEDAFWQDYAAGRCSLSLVYAVVCNGLPFVARPNGIPLQQMWIMQQRVGEQFRSCFFDAQLRTNSSGSRGRTLRLDDLEALALMVNFRYLPVGKDGWKMGRSKRAGHHSNGNQGKYYENVEDDDDDEYYDDDDDDAKLSPVQAHLASLYLTHDSLVLMTMQSGIHGSKTGADEAAEDPAMSAIPAMPAMPRARFQDRRILLFWHVYGLDAFYCMDKKALSRIPPSDTETSSLCTTLPAPQQQEQEKRQRHQQQHQHQQHQQQPTPQPTDDGLQQMQAPPQPPRVLPARHEPAAVRNYLDAVLDVCVLVRHALTTLSNATTRRLGVKPADVLTLYGLLEQWRETECPAHLRRQRLSDGRLSVTANLPTASGTGAGTTSSTGSTPAATTGGGGGGGNVMAAPGIPVKHTPLHRSVIWIAEANCCLQIAECVAEYGIDAGEGSGNSSLDAEMLALRVESETVRAVRDAAEIAQSVLDYDGRRPQPQPRGYPSMSASTSASGSGDEPPPNEEIFALADLAPTMLRDLSGHASLAACRCGRAWQDRRLPETVLRGRSHTGNSPVPSAAAERERRRTHMRTYLDAARVLHAVVASAVSHPDTAVRVKTIGAEIRALERAMTEV